MESKTTLVKNLETIMAARGIKSMELSFDARLPLSRICDILRGKTISPKIHTVAKLAKALDVTVDDLINPDYEQKAD